MRVDILSSPETVQAARTTSLTAGSRSPSFSEAMSRTSPGESLKAASKGAPTPSGPLPATKSAAEPNLPAQTSQAARAVQLSNTGVRSDAGANTKCEVQSDVKLDSKAGAQAAPQSTSKAALKVVAKASPDANMSSANTSSAKAGVTVTGIPGPQVAGAASVMTSAILPATLFAALPVAALPTSNALPASNVPLLGATSTAARGPSPTAGSTANPTPVVPSVAVPSFVSPVISTALAPSAIASAGRPIATQVSTSAQSNSGEQVSSMARRTVANNSGLDLPAAHLSTPSADFTAQSLSPAPANGSNTPPLTTLGPVQGASDPGSGSTRPATPDAVDHADALLKDVAGPEVGTKATVDNANSFDSAFRFPVSNAAVGDVPHLRSEPASPTPALPLADAAAAGSAIAPAPSVADAGTKDNETASPSKALPLSFADTTVRIAAPLAFGPQSHATVANEVQHPAASRSAPSASDGSTRGTTPAASVGSPINAVRSQTSESAFAQVSSAGDASASLAGSQCDAGPTANAVAIGTAPSSSANSDAVSVAPDSTYPSAGDPANAAQQASPAGAASASSPGQKWAGTSRSTAATTAASSTTPASITPAAAGSPAGAALAVPTPQPNESASATPEKAGAAAELPPAHQMLDSAPLPGASEGVSAASVGHLTPDSSALQMQVGVHTSAFGNVEVHTVIEQSQVGISIHGDRELARWFSSEVGGLEAGLKNQHLNLTGVDFSSTRSGVQTATSFQHGQPRQNLSQTSGSYSAASATETTATESTIETDLTAALPAQGPETRVSILV